MCNPFSSITCAAVAAVEVASVNPVEAALDGLGEVTHTALEALALMLASWLLLPTQDICPDTGAGWMSDCLSGDSPAVQVRAWLLPLTAIVAVLGVLWQATTMVISRKGEPLLIIVKALAAIALWGAVGIIGTQLVLWAGDSYTNWILLHAIGGSSDDAAGSLALNLAAVVVAGPLGPLVITIVELLFIVGFLVQIVLLIFREAAVTILAGELQLAAAGGLTRLTGGWLGKVTGWMLALVAYKPVAASVYAAGFALLRGDGRNSLAGLAMLVLSLIALPALMRLFSWTVGSAGQPGGAMGMVATTLAAGLHGMSAMQGVGGYGASDHARWMATQNRPPGAGAGEPGPGGGGGGPVGGPHGATIGGAGAPVGPVGSGGPSGSGIAGSGTGAGAGVGAGAGAGVGAGAGAAGAAVAGPAGVAVAAAGAVTSTAGRAAQQAADSLTQPPNGEAAL